MKAVGHRPHNKGSIARDDSNNKDKEFKSNNGFGLKRFKCSAGASTISQYSVLCYPITVGLPVSEW